MFSHISTKTKLRGEANNKKFQLLTLLLAPTLEYNENLNYRVSNLNKYKTNVFNTRTFQGYIQLREILKNDVSEAQNPKSKSQEESRKSKSFLEFYKMKKILFDENRTSIERVWEPQFGHFSAFSDFCRFCLPKWIYNLDFMGSKEILKSTKAMKSKIEPNFTFFENAHLVILVLKFQSLSPQRR